jgi:hypothetical protein
VREYGELTDSQVQEFAVISRQVFTRWCEKRVQVLAWMQRMGRSGTPTFQDFCDYDIYWDSFSD